MMTLVRWKEPFHEWAPSMGMGFVAALLVLTLGLSLYTSHENNVLLSQIRVTQQIDRSDQITLVQLAEQQQDIEYALTHGNNNSTGILKEICRLTPGCTIPVVPKK